MPFSRTDLEAPAVGSIIISGFRVLANYRNQHVIAENLNLESPEPFVVWNLDAEGSPYSGSYFSQLEGAQVEFVERCFPWFWNTEQEEAPQTPEERIDFDESYPTHRVGRYKGWLVVQTYDDMDGGVLCYLPSDEWEGSSFPDLDYLKEHYAAEWQAGHLQEAIDFIDSYNQETVRAHLAGLEQYGIPKEVYVDSGTEILRQKSDNM